MSDGPWSLVQWSLGPTSLLVAACLMLPYHPQDNLATLVLDYSLLPDLWWQLPLFYTRAQVSYRQFQYQDCWLHYTTQTSLQYTLYTGLGENPCGGTGPATVWLKLPAGTGILSSDISIFIVTTFRPQN